MQGDKPSTTITKLDDDNGALKNKNLNPFFLEEDRSFGNIRKGVVWRFIQSMGGFITQTVVFLLSLAATSLQNIVSFLFLIYAQQLTVDTKRDHVWLIIGTCVLISLALMLQILFLMLANLNASRGFHARMSYTMFHCQVSEFLERIPQGRLVNLFSEDVEAIDTDIVQYLTQFHQFTAVFFVQISIIVYSAGSPFLLIPCVLLLILGVWIRGVYMNMKREVLRLKRISKSPITSLLSESISETVEMRAFKRQGYIMNQLDYLMNENNKNNLTLFALDGWFSTIMIIATFFLVTLPSFGYVLWSLYYDRSNIDMKYLVMFLTTSTEIGHMLVQILENICGIESLMVSIERCLDFEKSPVEKGYKYLDKQRKEFMFPKKATVKHILEENCSEPLFPYGDISLKNASARYNTNDPDILHNLSLKISKGEKIGIVGRTGSGKTTLIKLFWRAIELYEGELEIDGLNIHEIDLKTLRKEITIVSQEAALFSGSLRTNIDPGLEYVISKETQEFKDREEAILKHLVDLGFSSTKLGKDGLDLNIVGNGENLSMGERQIIALTRALISKNKVILLDEATSSIDLETEEQMQKLIFDIFSDRTILIIAHRIQTVLKCDRILVLEQGEILEFDTVDNLLAKKHGAFKEIYKQFNQ